MNQPAESPRVPGLQASSSARSLKGESLTSVVHRARPITRPSAPTSPGGWSTTGHPWRRSRLSTRRSRPSRSCGSWSRTGRPTCGHGSPWGACWCAGGAKNRCPVRLRGAGLLVRVFLATTGHGDPLWW